MKYLKNLVGKDDHIVDCAHTSLAALIPAILMTLSIIFIKPGIKMLAAILTTHLGYSTKKLIGKRGGFSSVSIEAPLEKVDNAEVSKSFFGQIFDYGTIKIKTNSGEFTFEYIKHADRFRTGLMDAVYDFNKQSRFEPIVDALSAFSGMAPRSSQPVPAVPPAPEKEYIEAAPVQVPLHTAVEIQTALPDVQHNVRPIAISYAEQHGGRSVHIREGSEVTVGRDPARCILLYRDNTSGVSGLHCSLSYDFGKDEFIVTDLGSTFGTYLMPEAKKLEKGVPYRVKKGQMLSIGDPQNTIKLDLE